METQVATLGHPHCVETFDVGDNYYSIMEFCEEGGHFLYVIYNKGVKLYKTYRFDSIIALAEVEGFKTAMPNQYHKSTKEQYLDQVLPERKEIGYSSSDLYYDRYSKQLFQYCDFDQEIKPIDKKTALKEYGHQLDSSEISFLSQGVWTRPKLSFWLVAASRSYLCVCTFALCLTLLGTWLVKDSEKLDLGPSILILLSLPASVISCARGAVDD